MLCRLCNVLGARLLVPDLKCLGADRVITGGCQSVSSWVEMTVDESVSGEKALSLPGRFETLHLPLPPPCRSM